MIMQNSIKIIEQIERVSMEIVQKTTQKSPKSAEVARLLTFKKQKCLTWDALSDGIDVPKRTITNYVWDTGQLGGAVLRGMLVKYGVSTDWILTGKGEMYLEDKNDMRKLRSVPDRCSGVINETDVPYAVNGNGKDNGDSSHTAPLLPFLDTVDPNSLQDCFYITAASIEQSLMQCGAIPGVDYTRLDLYKLAQPFVLQKFKDDRIAIEIFEES
jgi:hypothetical protein